jgi:hypothetical protein
MGEEGVGEREGGGVGGECCAHFAADLVEDVQEAMLVGGVCLR